MNIREEACLVIKLTIKLSNIGEINTTVLPLPRPPSMRILADANTAIAMGMLVMMKGAGVAAAVEEVMRMMAEAGAEAMEAAQRVAERMTVMPAISSIK